MRADQLRKHHGKEGLEIHDLPSLEAGRVSEVALSEEDIDAIVRKTFGIDMEAFEQALTDEGLRPKASRPAESLAGEVATAQAAQG
jgi:hypothetical protein